MVVLIWIICAIASAIVGYEKGEAITAFFAGAIFGPLGLIFAFLSKGNKRRACPFCKELVQKEAVRCPHCQKDIEKVGK